MSELKPPKDIPIRGYGGRYLVKTWDTGYRTRWTRRRIYRFTLYCGQEPIAAGSATLLNGVAGVVTTVKFHSQGRHPGVERQ